MEEASQDKVSVEMGKMHAEVHHDMEHREH